jgi:hypothetical protein
MALATSTLSGVTFRATAIGAFAESSKPACATAAAAAAAFLSLPIARAVPQCYVQLNSRHE